MVSPGSHCFSCGKPVAWYDNLPVVSWCLLRGKCRHCGTTFSVRYAVLEAMTASLFLAVWMQYGPSGLTLVYWLMCFGLLLGSGVDLDKMWIPDRVTKGGMILGIPLSALLPELQGQLVWHEGLLAASLGAAAGFGSLWAVGKIGTWLFKKDAMGFGDVKLMGAIGAFLGAPAILYTLFMAALLGSIVGVGLIALGKKALGGRIPFGPYLSAAAISWIFGGARLLDWYLDLFRLPGS